MNIIIGGEYSDGNEREWHVSDDVLKFDVTSKTWIQVSKLKHARSEHAMSSVRMEENQMLIKYCK